METIAATVIVRYMSEWRGLEKWAVEVEGHTLEGVTLRLVDLTDIIARTKGEAVTLALVAVRGGFTLSGSGWTARVPWRSRVSSKVSRV